MGHQCWPPGGRHVYLTPIMVKLVLTLAIACVVWWSRSKEPHNRPTMEAVHDAVAAIPKIDRRSGMLSSPLP